MVHRMYVTCKSIQGVPVFSGQTFPVRSTGQDRKNVSLEASLKNFKE